MEPTTVLNLAVQLAVPRLGDLALVDLLGRRGLELAAVASYSPSATQELEELRDRYPVDPTGPHPVAQAVRENKPIWVRNRTDLGLKEISQSEEHLAFMRRQGYRSSVVCPLRDERGTAIGAFSVLRFASRLPFGPLERDLVTELVKRTSRAYANATLYDRLRSRLSMLEEAFDSVDCGITLLDGRGFRLYANRVAARLIGKEEPAEVCGRLAGWLERPEPFVDISGRPLPPTAFPPLAVLEGRAEQSVLPISCRAGGVLVKATAIERADGRFVLCQLTPLRDGSKAI
jgi:PAS domain-containing protein